MLKRYAVFGGHKAAPISIFRNEEDAKNEVGVKTYLSYREVGLVEAYLLGRKMRRRKADLRAFIQESPVMQQVIGDFVDQYQHQPKSIEDRLSEED